MAEAAGSGAGSGRGAPSNNRGGKGTGRDGSQGGRSHRVLQASAGDEGRSRQRVLGKHQTAQCESANPAAQGSELPAALGIEPITELLAAEGGVGEQGDGYMDLVREIHSLMRAEAASNAQLTSRVGGLESALASARNELSDLRTRSVRLEGKLDMAAQATSSPPP